MICDNIKIILDKIEHVKNNANRRDAVKLVVVTKTVSADKVKEAIGCGVTSIGENRVQEAEQKFSELSEFKNVEKHLIGHLQTNKAKKAVELFDLIQSVDSIHLLTELDKRSQIIGKTQNCLVEIKVSEEETKYGLNPNDLGNLLEKAKEFKNVRILGMMAIAPYFDDPELSRPYFRKAYKYYSQYASDHSLSYLSMGMTHDFEIAIEEGSNMVRIGTAIFGART